MKQSDVRVLPPGSLVVEVTWGPERHRATLDAMQPLVGVDDRGRLVTGADDGRTARVWFTARGNCVYAMSVDARTPAHIGNMALPAAWSPLSLPCSLQLGPLAIKVLTEVDGQRRKTPSGEVSHIRATLESPATTDGVTRVCPPLALPEASPPNDVGTTRLIAPIARNTPYPPRMAEGPHFLPSLADPADNEAATRVLPSLADPTDNEGSTRVIAPFAHPADLDGVTRVLPPGATGPDESPASGSTRIAPPIAPAMPSMPPMGGGALEPAATRIQQPLTPPPDLASHFPPRLQGTDVAAPPQAFAVRTGPSMSSSSATVHVHAPPKKRKMSPLLIVGLAALPLALGAVWWSGRPKVARPTAPHASTTVAAASAPRPPTSVAAAPRAGSPTTTSSEPRTAAVKVAPPSPFAETVPSVTPDAVARDADRRIAAAMFAGDYARAAEASSALGSSDATSARYTVIARVLRTKAARSTR